MINCFKFGKIIYLIAEPMIKANSFIFTLYPKLSAMLNNALIIIVFACLSAGSLSAQDLIYTVTGDIDNVKTSLDSILVENLTNSTRIVFINLPVRNEYQINLTQKAYWGTTGIPFLHQGNGFTVIRNLPGTLTIGYLNGIPAIARLSVYNLKGQKVFSSSSVFFSNASPITINLGSAGVYLVSIESQKERQTFKAIGKQGAGDFQVRTEDSYAYRQTASIIKNATNTDFSYQKGDSIRVSVYKKTYYSYPKYFRIDNSKPLPFKLSQSTTTLTGISDSYVSLAEKVTGATYNPVTGKAQLSYSGTAPGLKFGDVIVIETDTMGFLRKVISSTEANGKATLETKPAYLNEVFVNQEIKLDTKLMKPEFILKSNCSLKEISAALTDKNGYIHPAEVFYQDKAGKRVSKNVLLNPDQFADTIPIIDFLKDFSKTDLHGIAGDVVHFYIDEGNISLKSSAVFEFNLTPKGKLDADTKVEKGDLKYFKFYLDNQAGFKTKLALDLTKSYSKVVTGEKVINARKVTAKFNVNGVPVWITFDCDIYKSFQVNATALVNATWGFEGNYHIQAGGNYDGINDSFTPISGYEHKVQVYPLNVKGELNAFAHFELYPRTEIMFYGFFGPFVEIVPFSEGGYSGKIISQITPSGLESFLGWYSAVAVGLDARVGTKLEFLWGLFDKSFGPQTINCYKNTLWYSPSNIERVSKWPENVIPGMKVPLTFKVTDKSGNAAPLVVIYIQGTGFFNKQVMVTDLNGLANIEWTLSESVSNSYTAAIYDSEGRLMKSQSSKFGP